MLTIKDLQDKVDGLKKQVNDSMVAYNKSEQALKQQLANHNALEGALMLAQQMVEEEMAKEQAEKDKKDVPAE